MATPLAPYDLWLADKLLALNPEVDTDVFVMYISSMLEEDSPVEEKRESILDLLAEVLETDREVVCDEILKKYDEIHNQNANQKTESAQKNIADQLSNMLEAQTIETVKVKDPTSEEAKARKAAILAQYSNVSDEEDGNNSAVAVGGGTTPGAGAAGGAPSDPLLMKNTNAESVGQMEKEKREKAKEDSDKKKEKDKQDRAQQKQKTQDRKETEKKRTQKGERRR